MGEPVRKLHYSEPGLREPVKLPDFAGYTEREQRRILHLYEQFQRDILPAIQTLVADHPTEASSPQVELIKRLATVTSARALFDLVGEGLPWRTYDTSGGDALKAYNALYNDDKIHRLFRQFARAFNQHDEHRTLLVHPYNEYSGYTRRIVNETGVIDGSSLLDAGVRSGEYEPRLVEEGVRRFGLWEDRLEATFASAGIEGMVREVGIILFKECGYAATRTLDDILPASIRQLLPAPDIAVRNSTSLMNLGIYGMGNCRAKADAANFMLMDVARRLYDLNEEIEVSDGGALTGKMTGAVPDRAIQRDKLRDGMRSKGFITAADAAEVANTIPKSTVDTIVVFEEHLLGRDRVGIPITHVRLVTRLQKVGEAPKYLVVDADKGGAVVQDWSPSSDGCYYGCLINNSYSSSEIGTDVPIFLAADFNLPPDFRFRREPYLRTDGSGMNTFRATVEAPEQFTEPVHVEEEDLIVVQSLTDTVKALGIVVNAAATTEDAGIRSEADQALSTLTAHERTSSSLLRDALQLLKDNPLYTAGAAAAAACLTAVTLHNTEPNLSVQNQIASNQHELDADPKTTAALERLQENSAAMEQWQRDVLLARPFQQALADSMDVVDGIRNGQLAEQSVALVDTALSGETALSATVNSKVEQVIVNTDDHGVVHLNVELGPTVVTVGPSFWIPLFREAVHTGQAVQFDLQSDTIDTTAVAASFAMMWNKLEHQPSISALTAVSLTCNGDRLLESRRTEGKFTNTSFNDHFIVEQQYGRIVPTVETATAAWSSCETHTDALPSQWRSRAASLWVQPLCETK